MAKIFLDFMGEEKVSVIKDKARKDLIEDLLVFLNERYDRARQISGNEIGVVIGQAPDEDKFASDLVGVVKVSIKPWYNKSDLKRPVRKFDLDSGSEYSDEDIANGKDDPNGADAYEAAVNAKKAPKK